MNDLRLYLTRLARCCMVAAALAEPSDAADFAELAQCRAIRDKDQRLDCYDSLTAREQPLMEVTPLSGAQITSSAVLSEKPAAEPPYRWSIEDEHLHRLRPHKPNYIMLRQSSGPNNQPFRASSEFLPVVPAPAPVHLDHNEMKFQVSVKAALVRDLPLMGGDLWFAYTQQSNWQVWNAAISRPFRETNYEPEFMLAYQLNRQLAGAWALRQLTWSLNHQSNGRGEPLSRSWNRIYAQLEFDRGKNLEVLVRPWWRIPEGHSSDDNPAIEHYMGHGDVVVNYKAPTWNASLLLRNNLERKHNRGAAQLDVAFPCARLGDFILKMQIFSGYGESLIDYNHRQTTIGLGVEATGWMDRTFPKAPTACSR